MGFLGGDLVNLDLRSSGYSILSMFHNWNFIYFLMVFPELGSIVRILFTLGPVAQATLVLLNLCREEDGAVISWCLFCVLYSM